MDDVRIVNSYQLEWSASQLAEDEVRKLHDPDVAVNAKQLRAACQLLQDAEPSVIKAASGPVEMTISPGPQERPGFIYSGDPERPEILIFSVGVLPSTMYRIDRDGVATEVDS